MSAIFYGDDTSEEFGILLASVDESEGWDVDISEVWKKGDKYFLLTASGCSCWGGEYEQQEFNSLGELGNLVLYREGYQYNPSLEGAKKLVAEAMVKDGA